MSNEKNKAEGVEELIMACKYGYEYHASTQFPELSFEDNCKNNFLQKISNWQRKDPAFIAEIVEKTLAYVANKAEVELSYNYRGEAYADVNHGQILAMQPDIVNQVLKEKV